MKLVSATTGTVFPELQSLGVISLVLGCCICPLLTLSTGEVNDSPGFGLSCHAVLLYDLGKGTSAYCSTPFPDGEAQPRL
jgi:hypothetical protein